MGTVPVYQEMAGELEAMVGPTMHRTIVGILDQRRAAGTALAHPVVRRRRPKA